MIRKMIMRPRCAVAFLTISQALPESRHSPGLGIFFAKRLALGSYMPNNSSLKDLSIGLQVCYARLAGLRISRLVGLHVHLAAFLRDKLLVGLHDPWLV